MSNLEAESGTVEIREIGTMARVSPVSHKILSKLM